MQWVKAGFAKGLMVEPPKGMRRVLWGRMFGEWPTQHIPVNLKAGQISALFTWGAFSGHEPSISHFIWISLFLLRSFHSLSAPVQKHVFILLHILSPLSVEGVAAFFQWVQIFPQEKKWRENSQYCPRMEAKLVSQGKHNYFLNLLTFKSCYKVKEMN